MLSVSASSRTTLSDRHSTRLILGDQTQGVSLVSKEFADDLKAFVERQKSYARTHEQQIEDGVAFCMDTRLGGN